MKFHIGRGHDGPARLGDLILDEQTTFETPVLAGATPSKVPTLSYISHDAGTPLQLKSTQFLSSEAAETSGMTLVLLPSMISFSEISRNGPTLDLQFQLEYLESYLDKRAEQAVVRIPSGSTNDLLEEWMPKFAGLGVHAASLPFDGLLGSEDSSSISLRSHLPLAWLTLALGRIHPSSIPLLYYLGFDVIDTGHAYEAAARGERLWSHDTEEMSGDDPIRFCSCSSCLGSDGTLSLEALESHNVQIYYQMLSQARSAMRNGRLRWLVESMTHASPANASLLRHVDSSLYKFVEEFTPSTGAKHLPLIGPESYNAPAVKRFRDYVSQRYSPPEGKRILLLLPCSARKPYSDSKSHKRFQLAIESGIGRASEYLSETILTSPLGVVPRELERTFPAASYDIPVTGVWDYEETEIAASALVAHLEKFSAAAVVVAHVSGGYLDIVKRAEDKVKQPIIYTTAEDPPAKRESLDALRHTLRDLSDGFSGADLPHRHLQEIVRATADFQFGGNAGVTLVPDGTRIRGKPYGTILCKIQGEQVCSFVGSTGTLSLTLAGGALLQSLGNKWVRLEAPRAKGGSIFAVGIKEADSDIRPGDEVLVLNPKDELVAVGRSEMSGREMCELTRGRAVSIRHKLEE